jgi:hypothetical protein
MMDVWHVVKNLALGAAVRFLNSVLTVEGETWLSQGSRSTNS